jgi:8-oxo-dGTP diphosphatase
MDGGRLLILRKRGRDEWVFPKGRVQRGETLRQAAEREIREETGLAVRTHEPLGATEFTYGAGDFLARKHVEWFLAEPAGGELHLESLFAEAAFLDAANAAVRVSHEDDRVLAARAFVALRSRADASTMQLETA